MRGERKKQTIFFFPDGMKLTDSNHAAFYTSTPRTRNKQSTNKPTNDTNDNYVATCDSACSSHGEDESDSSRSSTGTTSNRLLPINNHNSKSVRSSCTTHQDDVHCVYIITIDERSVLHSAVVDYITVQYCTLTSFKTTCDACGL
jgi:hypothetical protein